MPAALTSIKPGPALLIQFEARWKLAGGNWEERGELFMIDVFTQRSRIAYFSMEIALCAEIHTYSGGLGILAGDTVRSCADLELPVVFVTLVSRAGYLRQSIDAGAGRSNSRTRGSRSGGRNRSAPRSRSPSKA